jgi:hypothetical protein
MVNDFESGPKLEVHVFPWNQPHFPRGQELPVYGREPYFQDPYFPNPYA